MVPIRGGTTLRFIMRRALRYDWHAVTLPQYVETHQATRFYVANPTPEIGLNAYRSGGTWHWLVLAFLPESNRPGILRNGIAPTLAEAKLIAESAIPEHYHPQRSFNLTGDHHATDRSDPVHPGTDDPVPF